LSRTFWPLAGARSTTANGDSIFLRSRGRNYLKEPTGSNATIYLRAAGNSKRWPQTLARACLDLGHGVACLESPKMNVIGGDQLGMLKESLEEVRKNFAGLVIGTRSHFSAGGKCFAARVPLHPSSNQS